MSRATAKAFYDPAPGDPPQGYITPGDAQAAIDTIYDDVEAGDGAEAAARAAAVGTEQTSRIAADASEQAARIFADTAEQTARAAAVTAEADARSAADAAEAAARVAADALKADKARTISASGGLTGGGDLSADRTLSIAAGGVTSAMVADGTLVGADMAADTITAREIAASAVTSAKIADGTIVNADINASAAIAVSKLAGHATSTTDNALVRYDSTAGNQQNSGVILDDSRNMTGVLSITDAAMATATLGTELGDGVNLTQALSGLTIGQTYQVAAVSGTLAGATLDGAALVCQNNASSFVATATSHTVIGTSGTATAISVKLVTARSATVAASIAGARVSQQSTNTYVGTLPTKLTTGTDNTAVGANTHTALTTGTSNTAIGFNAARYLGTGSGNTAVGYAALNQATVGGSNNAVGQNALYALTTGYYNVAVGNNSLFSATTGGSNVALGQNAGRAITTGSYNLALGSSAGYSGTTATISGSVCIGTNSSGTGAQATADNQIVLGTSSHNTLISGSLEMTGSGAGIIVRSPDGTRYRLGVANGGAVSVTAL